ncbi:hypothetical protein FLP10_11600 [Agromyces intestinalis]|uniref:Type II toxin-antitoxin system HicB family antitoxin n=2 Tax=Agromyces TaxID=33877 RepID=A0A5C1YIV1_9MICO|nr:MULTISPECIES: hypothetical protein [Agromyces]QEO14987.1 hypothetical protein FLP10_11600 [Agromyces intestinalis]UOE42819.1 hypothetical protein MTO99_11520 [Agromyces larvae]
MSYTVEVTREGDAWIADVIDLDGAHTYARNLTALDEAVHEVIALVTDAADDDERPDLHYVYVGVDAEFTRAAELGEARDAAERRQRDLNAATATTAAKLAAAGYSVRDIAGVLKMSPGRVSQILGSKGVNPKVQNRVNRGKRAINGPTAARVTSPS